MPGVFIDIFKTLTERQNKISSLKKFKKKQEKTQITCGIITLITAQN